MRSECREVEDFAGRFDHMDKSSWELEISSFLNLFTQKNAKNQLISFHKSIFRDLILL
jgi:hypothetical protein